MMPQESQVQLEHLWGQTEADEEAHWPEGHLPVRSGTSLWPSHSPARGDVDGPVCGAEEWRRGATIPKASLLETTAQRHLGSRLGEFSASCATPLERTLEAGPGTSPPTSWPLRGGKTSPGTQSGILGVDGRDRRWHAGPHSSLPHQPQDRDWSPAAGLPAVLGGTSPGNGG
ncbi:unnamed protein product [Rangifer tarandus platyrhynchus]|uniref:Uncharacterized protein n=1 Tax=Rangifer tarandus platyrhynchus TaxID=3082113 RepID=A0ABN8YMJ1_RANTA|nr:unnamed protein product [Rangifer tarandus platyrhynchus]